MLMYGEEGNIRKGNIHFQEISMSEYVDINGAKIEKRFFEENVKEAKSYSWEALKWGDAKDHTHCIICGITLSSETGEIVYKSEGGYLCEYCFENFVCKR